MTEAQVKRKAKAYFKKLGHKVIVTSVERYEKPSLMCNLKSVSSTESGWTVPISPGVFITWWVNVSNGERTSAVCFEERMYV